MGKNIKKMAWHKRRGTIVPSKILKTRPEDKIETSKASANDRLQAFIKNFDEQIRKAVR